MTLQPIPTEFLIFEENFIFFFISVGIGQVLSKYSTETNQSKYTYRPSTIYTYQVQTNVDADHVNVTRTSEGQIRVCVKDKCRSALRTNKCQK